MPKKEMNTLVIGTNEYEVVDATARSGLSSKQDTLVSGTSIKTINNESLLGSGNIDIQEGGPIDTSISSTSENAVQNKVIYNALSGKADSSHSHGNITNAGAISSDTSVASGDKLILSDASSSGKLIRSNISFGSSTTTYLRNDGTWSTPSSSSSKPKMVLLWDNSSATSYTSGTPVSASTGSAYNMVLIDFYVNRADSSSAGYRMIAQLFLAKGYSGCPSAAIGTYRTASFNSNGSVDISANSSGTATSFVPCRIWGISL